MIYIYTYICGAQTLEVVPGTPSQSWSSHACVMPTPWVWKDLCVASNQQNTAIVAGWVWLWSHKILASPSLSSAFVLSLRKQVGVWDNSVWQEPGDACRAEGGVWPTVSKSWSLQSNSHKELNSAHNPSGFGSDPSPLKPWMRIHQFNNSITAWQDSKLGIQLSHAWTLFITEALRSI